MSFEVQNVTPTMMAHWMKFIQLACSLVTPPAVS